MHKLDHIGIAVKNLAASVPLFEKILNISCYKTETVPSENVNTAFFIQDGTKIELLESVVSEGSITKFINNRGEGLHHIAFEVENITAEILRLQSEGFHFINDEPKTGADNKLVCFLHPKETNGVLIELCQSITGS